MEIPHGHVVTSLLTHQFSFAWNLCLMPFVNPLSTNFPLLPWLNMAWEQQRTRKKKWDNGEIYKNKNECFLQTYCTLPYLGCDDHWTNARSKYTTYKVIHIYFTFIFWFLLICVFLANVVIILKPFFVNSCVTKFSCTKYTVCVHVLSTPFVF